MSEYRTSLLLAGAILLAVCPVSAQGDYRNLDDARPVRTEDAWPIEHRAWEWIAPIGGARHLGRTELIFMPELGWGVARNTMIGAKVPVVGDDGVRNPTVAGPRLFALYSFNAESPQWPGFALRTEATLPGGGAAGDGVLLTTKAIATRTWGRLRTHLNASATLGRRVDAPVAHAPERWSATAAADWSLVRQSTLLIAEVATYGTIEGGGQSWEMAVGFRRQLTPVLVLDAGIVRRLAGDASPDVGITLGLSRTFSIGTPSSRRTP